ncbi:MAG: DUF2207 domain-containing protein [Atribacterota bacterium]|nr:DUF2207 domain-containing protein [Atribacterota bacterium]
MKKLFLPFFFFLSSFFFLAVLPAEAAAVSSEYTIEDFSSEITVNQDTSLTVEERISVHFSVPKHGIFRVIPVIYNSGGRTIRANLKVVSITDEMGKDYHYEESRYRQSINLKIGDPQETITGPHIYVIKYTISEVLLPYEDHDEVYWNVTGHEWDTIIKKSSAKVVSPFAPITKIACFNGPFGSKEEQCVGDFNHQEAVFTSSVSLNPGDDFTIVVALSKDNQLKFPGLIKRIVNFLTDNWGYLAAITPFLIIFAFWYKKGRDKKYLTDNIYYQPEEEKTETVPLFHRDYLPTVYSPLDNLTPAQAGTIIDEKVDIQDVVAEIVEMARLGYLHIKKTEKKGLIGKKTDYLFIKKEKDENKLKDYQRYLLLSLFAHNKEVPLSSLKNDFYKYLPAFKKKLYKNLVEEKIFVGNPETVRAKWLTIAIIMLLGDFVLLLSSFISFAGSVPLVLFFLFLVPTILMAKSMPRRTAWGYSLYRQVKGLQWYINKSKWREEIAEKHLFLEEILPLAISLGVVEKLTKEMGSLGVKPPDYFEGAVAASFYSDWRGFYKNSTMALSSSPSGKSTWSGGSGFSGGGSSGGSSGGGFGGGGGGSW